MDLNSSLFLFDQGNPVSYLGSIWPPTLLSGLYSQLFLFIHAMQSHVPISGAIQPIGTVSPSAFYFQGTMQPVVIHYRVLCNPLFFAMG